MNKSIKVTNEFFADSHYFLSLCIYAVGYVVLMLRGH